MNQTVQCNSRERNFHFIKNDKENKEDNSSFAHKDLRMSNCNKQNYDWTAIVEGLKKKTMNMRCKTDCS